MGLGDRLILMEKKCYLILGLAIATTVWIYPLLSIPLNILQKSAIYSMSRSAFLLAGIVNLSDSNGLFNVLTASSATPSVSPPQS